MTQRGVFRLAKALLPGISENLGYRSAFAALNAVVQILKVPIQPLAQSPAHAALSGAHKAHQKNSVDAVWFHLCALRDACTRVRAFAFTGFPERFFKRSGFLFVVILRSVF